MQFLIPRMCLWLFAVAIGLNFLVSAQAQSTTPTGDGQTAKPRLSPEERAALKQQKAARENELAVKRLQNFGMIQSDDNSELAKTYEAAFNRFREALIDLDQVNQRHQLVQNSTLETRQEIIQSWCNAISKGNQAYADWLLQAGNLYTSDPEKYVSIGEALREMLLADVEQDRFDAWLEPAKALVKAKKLDNEAVLSAAGFVGFAHSDFDFAEQCWKQLQEAGTLPRLDELYLSEIEPTREKWKRELEFRAKDAEKNDNPQVEIITTKGRIVVELYEDVAPEAVKSFIYLVENNYYVRKSFFRVEKHVCAQTGCEKADGTGNAGYTIPGEADSPEHRDHFRGSMAVALGMNQITHEPDPNSGGAQFYFAFLPMPHLDGKHTVFGRIVEGQPSVNLFRVMNLANKEEREDKSNRPDMIISTKVLRKRDTNYRPQVVAGKLFR